MVTVEVNALGASLALRAITVGNHAWIMEWKSHLFLFLPRGELHKNGGIQTKGNRPEAPTIHRKIGFLAVLPGIVGSTLAQVLEKIIVAGDKHVVISVAGGNQFD
jgi:hypothetical protein